MQKEQQELANLIKGKKVAFIGAAGNSGTADFRNCREKDGGQWFRKNG